MNLKSLDYYLRHPVIAARTVVYKLYEWTHPDEPWFSPKSVRYLDQTLNKSMSVFEWGSGRSTMWLAKRVHSVISIEYDQSWHSRVQTMLDEGHIGNASVLYVPLEHPKKDPTPLEYDPLPKYVSEILKHPNESFDLVIIDGHYRLTCTLHCLNKIKPGGYILIDNSNRVERKEWKVPEDWVLVHESENVKTRTSIWQKPLN